MQEKTNRHIATACYLSEKTVERHVSHLLAKLGVATRTGVATIVVGQSRSWVIAARIEVMAPSARCG